MSVKINYNGAQIAEMSESGTKTLKTGGTFVPHDISVEYAGSGSTAANGVYFLDYDGSVVTSWDSSTVAGKTALPDNPTHTGLVAQGWNWTLAGIKSYIAKYPDANVFVGQMYKTASGLTEMDVTVTKVTGLTVTCNMSGNKNWGDGTTDSATSHTYADYGDYTITCGGTEVPAGTSNKGGMFGSSGSACTAVRIGGSVTSCGMYAFSGCRSVTNITIPEGVTNIDHYAFSNCYSLRSITFPEGVTSFGGLLFQSCSALTSIALPEGVTSINGSAFYQCRSLTNITLPEGITSIGGNAFFYCHSLTSIALPESVTLIGSAAFEECHSLRSITLPEGITSIGGNEFSNCRALIEYDFSDATAVSALANTNAFTNISPLCKIKVPASLYQQWIAATNWTAYADYIVAV